MTSTINMFGNPRTSLQRLGFLKHLMSFASRSSTNNVATLGHNLYTSVSQKTLIPLDKDIITYTYTTLKGKKYTQLKSKIPREYDPQSSRTVSFELQDLFLSRSILPSNRGKLVEDDQKRYPFLAVELGLISPGTYSLMVRGHSFVSLLSDDEKTAFSKFKTVIKERLNPFILTIPQKLLLLYSFLEKDGEVISRLYKELLKIEGDFSDKTAGNFLPAIYRSIANNSRTKARSGDDLVKIQKILNTADKIEHTKKRVSPGGKNPRAHAIVMRLEPFVDIGLIVKSTPDSYNYRLSDNSIQFFNALISSSTINNFCQSSFFNTANIALDLDCHFVPDPEIQIQYLQKAYTILKSPLGYAPILELCLLSSILAITESSVYFEISDLTTLLQTVQKRAPRQVRFNVDRLGETTVVKFETDITSLVM